MHIFRWDGPQRTYRSERSLESFSGRLEILLALSQFFVHNILNSWKEYCQRCATSVRSGAEVCVCVAFTVNAKR
jgi:hypothetical protein